MIMNAKDEGADRRGLLPRYTLKDGNSFLLSDALGDVQGSDDGLFHDDTRMLSRFELDVAGRRPSLLGASIDQDNTLFTAHLTNRPLAALGEHVLPQGVIYIERTRFLWRRVTYERMAFTNFSDEDARIPLRLQFDADFADIFEVQGHVRKARGQRLPPESDPHGVRLSYRGLDGRPRSTYIKFSPAAATVNEKAAEFIVELKRSAAVSLYIAIGPEPTERVGAELFAAKRDELRESMRGRIHEGASIETSGRVFNAWVDKSRADLALLTTVLPTGPYPYAGIPWFATQFGRDAIITSLQTLWLDPSLASGVLAYLASTQATGTSAFRDSEPGKIMHETRRGEMAALEEVPFGRYYGGVDTTPLFVMLAGAYEQRTGDPRVVDGIWKELLAAIGWIERRLEASATGFLDYARGEASGLANQGWKDSQDSIFHADGRMPTGPIAVVEVQGYVYAAFLAMSELAAAREQRREAAAWRSQAQRMRAAIEDRFWSQELDSYVIALDGAGSPCQIRASNTGHLLFCGVPSEERGQRVISQLLSPQSASGWGIRTLAKEQARFNPMSYHNGSVWPHDTALCAAGISRYGGREQAVQLLSEIFEAATHFSMRLPELYCGFDRVAGQTPTPYPVACLPQAWASGSVFMLLQATLGVHIDGLRQEVRIERPFLPIGIESLTIRGLMVKGSRVDLEFHRVGGEVIALPTKRAADSLKVLIVL